MSEEHKTMLKMLVERLTTLLMPVEKLMFTCHRKHRISYMVTDTDNLFNVCVEQTKMSTKILGFRLLDLRYLKGQRTSLLLKCILEENH